MHLPDSHLLGQALAFPAGRRSRSGSRLLLEELPELQALVRGSSSKHLAVRAEGGVKDTGLVGGDLDVLDEGRVTPDGHLVVGSTVAGDDLAVVGGPLEGGNLGTGIDSVDASTGGGVPEVNLAIVGTSSGGEEVVLPRAPGESLDGGFVVGLGELGSKHGTSIPNVDEVVVAARCELSAIGAPFETADLGSVTVKLTDLVLGDADVVVEDVAGPGTGGESCLVP